MSNVPVRGELARRMPSAGNRYSKTQNASNTLCTETIQNVVPSFLDFSAGMVPWGRGQRRKGVQEMKSTSTKFYATDSEWNALKTHTI